MSDNLATVISKVSPILSGALNAFVPGTGFIVSGLAKLFGADVNSEQDIIAKIQADPEAYLKLRQFELEHYSSLLQIALEDKKSARAREMEYAKAGRRDFVMDTISIIIVVGFFGMALFIGLAHIQDASKDILYILMGQLSSGFVIVLGYFYGSSVSPRTQSPMLPQTPDVILPPPAQTR